VPSVSRINLFSDLTKRHDTAVILHLFYPELWEEISTHLENLDDDFDLFVSISHEVDFRVHNVLSRYPQAYIYRCQNRGRDIAPFLSIFTAIYPLQYKTLCKIHTKRSRHLEDGDVWRQDLLHKLLGSRAIVKMAKDVLEEREYVGMLVPQGHLIPSRRYMGNNIAKLERLAHLAGILYTGQEFWFGAGSMFWFRPSALYPLTLLPLTQDDFDLEQGQKDGTLAHAFERVFGLIPHSMGVRILEISPSGAQEPDLANQSHQYRFVIATKLIPDLQTSRDELARMEEENANLHRALKTSRAELARAQQDNGSLREELTRAQQGNEALRKELIRAQQDNESLREELAETGKSLAAAEHKSLVHAQEMTLKNLELDAATHRIQALEVSLSWRLTTPLRWLAKAILRFLR
jgi:lipopolysaccharide biosynthesis protein